MGADHYYWVALDDRNRHCINITPEQRSTRESLTQLPLCRAYKYPENETFLLGISLINSCRGAGLWSVSRVVKPSLVARIASAVSLCIKLHAQYIVQDSVGIQWQLRYNMYNKGYNKDIHHNLAIHSSVSSGRQEGKASYWSPTRASNAQTRHIMFSGVSLEEWRLK